MLAEQAVAAKRVAMRRLLSLLPVLALTLAPTACRDQPEGSVKVVVIGGEPSLRDPSEVPLTVPDEVLLQNVAQGLVGFDAGGNIVPGLAERWNVSDDGLSYIFRIASTDWADGRKVNAQQVARVLKRQLAVRSKNELKDTLGAVQDVVLAGPDRPYVAAGGHALPMGFAFIEIDLITVIDRVLGTCRNAGVAARADIEIDRIALFPRDFKRTQESIDLYVLARVDRISALERQFTAPGRA